MRILAKSDKRGGISYCPTACERPPKDRKREARTTGAHILASTLEQTGSFQGMGVADMEMKTSVVNETPTGADNGINRIALALLVAVGAVSAMGVGLTIFLFATIYGAAPFLIPLGIVSALGIGLVAAVVADP